MGNCIENMFRGTYGTVFNLEIDVFKNSMQHVDLRKRLVAGHNMQKWL